MAGPVSLISSDQTNPSLLVSGVETEQDMPTLLLSHEHLLIAWQGFLCLDLSVSESLMNGSRDKTEMSQTARNVALGWSLSWFQQGSVGHADGHHRPWASPRCWRDNPKANNTGGDIKGSVYQEIKVLPNQTLKKVQVGS